VNLSAGHEKTAILLLAAIMQRNIANKTAGKTLFMKAELRRWKGERQGIGGWR
jgi:hypothetical protein